MTSRFRLFTAGLVALLALLAGWLNGVVRDDSPISGRMGALEAPLVAATEDVDRYVLAIHSSDLFPEAQLRQAPSTPAEAAAAETLEQLAESLSDPGLSALVKRGDVWRIFLYGQGEGAQVREVGDQLADGWTIQAIDSTSVTLIRGDQSRRIEAFKAEPETP